MKTFTRNAMRTKNVLIPAFEAQTTATTMLYQCCLFVVAAAMLMGFRSVDECAGASGTHVGPAVEASPLLPSSTVIYVDDNAAGVNDGSSWPNAFPCLADALMTAGCGVEIRVAQGVYTPDKSAAFPGGTGDPQAAFCLVNGVILVGGYAGVSGPDPNERNVDRYETILSGDLAGTDENSSHVVVCQGVLPPTLMDGFTITGGCAAASSGGGLRCIDSSLTLRECRFISNSADDAGGGICHRGEILFEEDVILKLDGCVFRDNSSFIGGGIGCIAAQAELVDCHFSHNHAAYGPAVAQDHAKIKMTNCSLYANPGLRVGGAIQGNSVCLLENCTITKNSGGVELFPGFLTIKNSIIWGNTDFQIDDDPELLPEITVTCSAVEGGWPGTGNLDVDPLFADPNGGDLHLKSAYGRWHSKNQHWIYDSVTSACIDAGNPADPNWLRELWPHGKRLNMGVYGGTPQASKSPSPAGNKADFTGDDCIDQEDILIFIQKWLSRQILCPQDMDLDGDINFTDFALFSENWSFCPTEQR